MSLDIWPPISPEELKKAEAESQKRELDWLLEQLQAELKALRHGLEDCYALLAPVDPGNTLVVSTSRSEAVKGHVTRVGTRLVKGTIHLKLRTLQPQTLTLNAAHPIHIAPLTQLHHILNQMIDCLTMTATYPTNAPFLAAQLRVLSQSFAEAQTLLRGPPLPTPASPASTSSSQPAPPADLSWTRDSSAPTHFSPSLPPNLSFHVTLHDSTLVLWLRALEPADAPVHLSTKIALAIGTARRLEHDEADRVFPFAICCRDHDDGGGDDPASAGGHALGPPPTADLARARSQELPPRVHRHDTGLAAAGAALGWTGGGGGGGEGKEEEEVRGRRRPYPTSGRRAASAARAAAAAVAGGAAAGPGQTRVYVREKVRVESADPSLLSLTTKLSALANTLALARRNLGAVMGEEVEDEGIAF